MQTVTIAATAEHGLGFSTLAVLAISIIVVGLVAWQVVARARSLRHQEHLSHQGR